MLGRAAVAMWWDVAPEVRAEWEDWHSTEHMEERLAIPGFLRGSRWVAESGKPSYFVCYEVTDLKAITSGTYLERLNNPSPWSRKMMPQHRNMVRSLCTVRASSGGGLAGMAATIRFSGGMPALLPKRKGLTGAHALESIPAVDTPQTAEQKIRGGDAQADQVLVLCGYDVEAVKTAAAQFAPPDATVGLYRLAFSMTSRDLPR
jgi:hypothetical protein